jgi:hypothetical protein
MSDRCWSRPTAWSRSSCASPTSSVGRLRVRARSAPNPGLLRLLSTLIASEVERVRAPELASEEAAAVFVAAVLARELTGREEVLAAAREVGLRDLERGASVLIAHAHPQAPAQEGWRARLRAIAARAARAAVPSAVAVLSERDLDAGAEVIVLLAGADEAAARRAAEGVLRDLEAGMGGFEFVIGRSRPPPTRWSWRAPPTRRCWRRTWPRATRSTACSRSRRPAPTACCSAR